jgi:pimeloyl-ACP methyl ester carboxylesterase
MAAVVGVHGIGQQLRGERVLRETWLPALRDGVGRSAPDAADRVDLSIAFYGDLFRPKGGKAVGDIPYEAADVDDEAERDLLAAWWTEAARVEDVPGPESATKARTPMWVQRALNALSSSTFFAGIAERALVADLKQVRLFLSDPLVRSRVLDRVAVAVTADTRVIVGHSLGSVVAYEALCAHSEWNVRALVTLGSPLGISNVVFDRLTPRPVDGRGAWPGSVGTWTNIADGGDIVALRKQLAPQFGPRVRDELIYNGATAHDVVPYLTTEESGSAVAAGVFA